MIFDAKSNPSIRQTQNNLELLALKTQQTRLLKEYLTNPQKVLNYQFRLHFRIQNFNNQGHISKLAQQENSYSSSAVFSDKNFTLAKSKYSAVYHRQK